MTSVSTSEPPVTMSEFTNGVMNSVPLKIVT